MTLGLIALSVAAGGLPLDALDEDTSIGVVIGLAVNLDREDLDRVAAGLELSLARHTRGLTIVRVRPDDIPAGCGSDPACAARVHERLGVDEAWFLLLARVGDDVRFDGVTWSRGSTSSRPLEPFIVPRDALGDPTSYGASLPDSGGAAAASPEPAAPAVATDEPPPSAAPRVPLATWILGGAAVGALGTGIGFGVAAQSAESDASASGCGETRACPEDADRVEQLALAADVFYGVAAASAVGAVVMYFVSPRGRSAAGATSVSAAPLQGGGLVTVGGRF